MKTQKIEVQNNENQSMSAPAGFDAAILHEQLALQRIKELPEEPRKEGQENLEAEESAAAEIHRGWLWNTPGSLWVALFRRTTLARQMAPGQLPAEWSEIEELRQQRVMQMR